MIDCSDEIPEGLLARCPETEFKAAFEKLVGQYKSVFEKADTSAAESFATRMMQVWLSGGIRSLYDDMHDCAGKFLDAMDRHPKANLSAHNLRLLPGQKPKFSDRIKAIL